MKTMFALTHINPDGLRRLTRRNIGGNHFETKEIADEYLREFLESNSRGSLIDVYGSLSLDTFKIIPIECYDSGDSVNYYVDEPVVFES